MEQRPRKIDISDIHVYLGTALIGTGCGAIFWPAAAIVVGLILVWLGTRRAG